MLVKVSYLPVNDTRPPTIFYLILTMALEISAYRLAKAVGDYVESAQATDAIYRLLPSDNDASSRIESQYSGKVRCRTAWHWLKKLGFPCSKVWKEVYIDGHAHPDVVKFWQEVFLPAFHKIRPFLVIWDEEEKMIMPQNLPPGQKPLVRVTHDESTFNVNDGKRRLWMEDGK